MGPHLLLTHGGDIHVRSTPEEGTTFSVRLPLHPERTRQPGGACSGAQP
jgi:signal transduction histidine kinase